MPRLKRRSKHRTAGYSQYHLRELETGNCWPFLPADESFHDDRDAMQAAWAELGEIILAKWIAKHPGSRPWAWWEFTATERRKCLNDVHPFERSDRWSRTEKLSPDMQRKAYSLWYGKPATYGQGDFHCVFESQPDYLDRLGLLTDQERAALRNRKQPISSIYP